MDLWKVPKLAYQKRFYNKGHLNLETEFLIRFSSGFFNRLCENSQQQKNKNENYELRTAERAASIFLKLVPKAMVASSDS